MQSFRIGSALALWAGVSCGLCMVTDAFAQRRVEVMIECTDLNQTAKLGRFCIEGSGGDGQAPPWSVKSIRGVIQVRVVQGAASNFSVTKSVLSNTEAFGFGRPNGESSLPYAGPYVGAMWPFRDVADFFYSATNPSISGNTIGTVAQTTPGTFRIGDIIPGTPTQMIGPMALGALGGPTESTTSGLPLSPSRLDRGLPGTGSRNLDGSGHIGADFYGITLGTPDGLQRIVEVSFLQGSADIVVRNATTGEFRLESGITIPDVTVRWVIPAPGAAAMLAPAGMLMVRRRRR